LVADIHFSDIGTLCWQKLEPNAPCHILQMSVNGVSPISSFPSWTIHILIGCSHPFLRYQQPVTGKTTATCYLPCPENEHQPSVNNLELPILSNLCSDWLQTSIYQILAAFTGKNNCEMLHASSGK
jgi:hypothetical protein